MATNLYEPGQEIFLSDAVVLGYNKVEAAKMRGRRAFVVRTYSRAGEELSVVLNFRKNTKRQQDFQKFFLISDLRRMESDSAVIFANTASRQPVILNSHP